MNEYPTSPFESLRNCFTYSPKDWSASKREAWAYGIVVGWNDAIQGIANLYGWTDDDIAKLKQLRERFVLAEKMLNGGGK